VSIATDVALAVQAGDGGFEEPLLPARARREPGEDVLLDEAADAPVDARAVLAALYSAHAAAVQRFLRDLLGDATLAADATQETFARAFRRIETVRRDDRRVGWLFGIARNVSLEYRKARRLARSRFVDEEADAAPCEGGSPEAQFLGQEAAEVIARALVGLPEERRAALLLRLDHGLSYEEIAGALGWSVAKARVEVFRAREALRGTLEGYEGDGR
jgi:RNA polymerase sigma-70 factor, ECF subfamily